MEYAYIVILGAGFLGGLVRGLVGFIKHQQSYKDVPFRPWYLAGMLSLSGLVGLLAAYVTHDLGITFLGLTQISPAIAIILGYAGGDLIENLFKILIKQPDLFMIGR
ncbi:MAG: hypothetical protein WDZ85_02485 [Candidatus Paceibacterota bacterium]